MRASQWKHARVANCMAKVMEHMSGRDYNNRANQARKASVLVLVIISSSSSNVTIDDPSRDAAASAVAVWHARVTAPPPLPPCPLTWTENNADSARSRGIQQNTHAASGKEMERGEGRGEEGAYWNWMTDQMTDGLTACQPEQLKQNGSARKMPSQYSPSHSHSYSHSFRIRFILKCSWCRAFYSRSYVFIWITIFSFSVWVCVCVNCIVHVDNAKWHGYFFILFFFRVLLFVFDCASVMSFAIRRRPEKSQTSIKWKKAY